MTSCIYISIPWIIRRLVWKSNTRWESRFTTLTTCSWSPPCATKRSADVTNSIRIGGHISCNTSPWAPSWESHIFAFSVVTKLVHTSTTWSSSSSVAQAPQYLDSDRVLVLCVVPAASTRRLLQLTLTLQHLPLQPPQVSPVHHGGLQVVSLFGVLLPFCLAHQWLQTPAGTLSFHNPSLHTW